MGPLVLVLDLQRAVRQGSQRPPRAPQFQAPSWSASTQSWHRVAQPCHGTSLWPHVQRVWVCLQAPETRVWVSLWQWQQGAQVFSRFGAESPVTVNWEEGLNVLPASPMGPAPTRSSLIVVPLEGKTPPGKLTH